VLCWGTFSAVSGLLAKKRQIMNSAVISRNDFDAVLFDMDGVLTRTAAVHFAAWKCTFDKLLKERDGEAFKPFTQDDYLAQVDGKPREEGVNSFLQSRGIELSQSEKDQIARQKDAEFLNLIHTRGVEPYETTICLIKDLRSIGIKTALVTASRNGCEILRVTNTLPLFDAIVTGVEAASLKLRGKPSPDVFLEAARELSVRPERAAVVEDAEAGVESGRNGHFGLVIGVARQNNDRALLEHGANVVVRDLAEVSIPKDLRTSPQLHGMTMADLKITEANWVVSYDSYIANQEQRRESICTLGNGKFFTRGASSDSRSDGVHYPGTYVAGAYNTVRAMMGDEEFEREELVNMPNWLCLEFKIGDSDWCNVDNTELTRYEQKLNLREGVLYRLVHFKDIEGRETQVSERRFVHMQHSSTAGIELTITPINWSGALTVRTALDGCIVNSGDPSGPEVQRTKHLQPLEQSTDGNLLLLKMITNDSKLVIVEAARTEFSIAGINCNPARTELTRDSYVEQTCTFELNRSQELRIEKICCLYTSRDPGIYEPGQAAREQASEAPSFQSLYASQVDTWRSLWAQYDLFIETTEEHSKLVPSLLLHLNSFHSLQTASKHTADLDCGVPARGWTGEGYQGHVFWDDLFVFPFINLRMPNVSAALLKYRYRRLEAAREIAASYGAKGACFPWQSAGDGKERTPQFWWMADGSKWVRDHTRLEIHVNGAIAYNIWQYYQVSADTNFMYSFGAEMLLEIARFFCTYAEFNTTKDRYEILHVVGPDEFHNGYPGFEKPGINNNTYTNIVAVWTICRALDLLRMLPADHRDRVRRELSIDDDELKQWNDVSRRMYIPIMENGVVAQFEGYEALEEFPGLRGVNLDRDELKIALRKNSGYLNQYKLSKQADVLMLGFMFSTTELEEIIDRLGYPRECIAPDKTVAYYIPRTANESTLSRVALTWALARLARLDRTKKVDCSALSFVKEDEIFYEALGSDYFDVAARGTAKSGIHLGAMAGTVDIVQRCYTGIVTRDDVLWLDPVLPEPLVRLSFNINYQGQSLSFDIHQDRMQIHARHSSARPVSIGYNDQIYKLNAGETQVLPLTAVPGASRKRTSPGKL
jgi:HAD superfamily hydrolase (TIGR01509 family)